MSEPDELRVRLTALAPSLGKAQRQAARVMLESLDALAYLPASDLAEKAGVHTATVVRLAQRLGFEGYPHLQRSLRSTLSQCSRFLQEMDEDAGTAAATVTAVLAQARRNLEQLTRITSPETLAEVAARLSGARRTLVLGLGMAGPVAAHLSSSLRLLGIAADQPADPVSAGQQLGLLGPDDAVVAIDFHRYYRVTTDLAAAARRAGVPVIAFTDTEVSPLTESACHTLIVPSESPTPRTSLATAFAVVEAIIALTARADRGRAEESMRRIDSSYADLKIFVGE
ncbi:MurR/RpiR family transcriptional regulator [Streptomyces sp. 8L]|uniref:MurR/RpiR family transcriptional regulator n=1 Tax=Streptomyces sp. 8L TaxID=2877242 RepID=UPI001CD54D81|nr:MurR/RpiR family transcriptional regulator [Streptomyces sp. 8L]MCA1217030.1 MurR/RpiR family transcriptional regulator [Streptomyces sp. 8L]